MTQVFTLTSCSSRNEHVIAAVCRLKDIRTKLFDPSVGIMNDGEGKALSMYCGVINPIH